MVFPSHLTNASLLVTVCLLLSSCGTKADLPRDFCQRDGRTLSENERIVSALEFYVSSPFADKAWLWGSEFRKILPPGDPKVAALKYFASNPSCCSVDEPWVMQNGKLYDNLSVSIYNGTRRNFEWIYDVNIKFTDGNGYVREVDIATDPCGSFVKTNHG